MHEESIDKAQKGNVMNSIGILLMFLIVEKRMIKKDL